MLNSILARDAIVLFNSSRPVLILSSLLVMIYVLVLFISSCSSHFVLFISSCSSHFVLFISSCSSHFVLFISSCSSHFVLFISSCSSHFVLFISSCSSHFVLSSSCSFHVVFNILFRDVIHLLSSMSSSSLLFDSTLDIQLSTTS